MFDPLAKKKLFDFGNYEESAPTGSDSNTVFKSSRVRISPGIGLMIGAILLWLFFEY